MVNRSQGFKEIVKFMDCSLWGGGGASSNPKPPCTTVGV